MHIPDNQDAQKHAHNQRDAKTGQHHFLEAHEAATLYINENQEAAQSIVNREIEAVTGKAIDEEVIKNAFSRMTVDVKLNKDAIMKFAAPQSSSLPDPPMCRCRSPFALKRLLRHWWHWR